MDHARWMKEALFEAQVAADRGEVPVGAVVVWGDKVIARAHNEVELRHDATAHAEMLAMQRASLVLDNWRLAGSALEGSAKSGQQVRLYVTLEPCTMCVGAMVLARLDKLIFGATDPRQGAVGSIYDLSTHSELPHSLEVVQGVLFEDCGKLLTEFFSAGRIGRKKTARK